MNNILVLTGDNSCQRQGAQFWSICSCSSCFQEGSLGAACYDWLARCLFLIQGPEFREFLLTKLINAELSACRAPDFTKLAVSCFVSFLLPTVHVSIF